jgi:predicted TIM-barrel fold metal-dependent hydrolase
MPPIDATPAVYNDPEKALQAAQFMNNAIAEIVTQHPTRFKGVALLPTKDVGIMLNEFERAVTQLHAVGGVITVSPTSKPPDHADYMQLYQKAVDLNVPLWIHPGRGPTYPDYVGEPISKYWMNMILGYVYDSSVAMARIVFKGVFDTYPNLKLITHHHGAFITQWANRIQGSYDFYDMIGTHQDTTISKPYIEHFRKFYCDTVCMGQESEFIKAAFDFFGPDRVLFGTDAPYSTNYGKDVIMDSRYSVEGLDVTNKDLQNIFANNILKIIPH